MEQIRRLPFFKPNLPLHVYYNMTDQAYRDICIKAAEDVARITGQLLVPSSCINHKRRQAERRVSLFGRTYYVMNPAEMTKHELENYQNIID